MKNSPSNEDEFTAFMAEIRDASVVRARKSGFSEESIEAVTCYWDESTEQINAEYLAGKAAGKSDADMLRETLARAIQARNEGNDPGGLVSHLIAGMERVLERNQRAKA
jgi:hypothetical protein